MSGRGPELQPPLHVTNGDSAGNTLRQTTLGGDVLSWQDVLHEGPVRQLARSQLLRERAGFLADCGWGDRDAILASLERRDREFLDGLREGRLVVLWFEHDLFDQLQLLDSLALAHAVGVAPELIVVDAFPGRPDFHGLGELTAPELETLWPVRRRATPAVPEAAAQAWDAFREPDPLALVELARRGSKELPLLAPALRRLLEELPDSRDGLSRTERQALDAVAGGAGTPLAAFAVAQRLEQAPFLGDTWFFRTLAALGQGERRLLETDDGAELPPPPPFSGDEAYGRAPLRVTGAGLRVLRGEDDRVALLGLDRWLGGTHISAENDWRWDRDAASLVRGRTAR